MDLKPLFPPRKEINSSICSRSNDSKWLRLRFLALISLFCIFIYWVVPGPSTSRSLDTSGPSRSQRKQILTRCRNLNILPTGFQAQERSESDRYVPGTKAILLRNAKIWTGAINGTEVIYGDLLLDRGIIKAIGYIPARLLDAIDKEQLDVQDLQGAWISPGLVDLHSHIGVNSQPALKGRISYVLSVLDSASDGNSHKGPALPWLRSLDGLNTHDESYALAIAGGVTTAQVLPGSANNIGGQSFVIKLRPTAERSAISKVLEPPHTLNGTDYDSSVPPRWRHMKHACGENPSRTYSNTRMDSAWAFREAYNEARKIRDAQDVYCSKAQDGDWKKLGDWPEDLKWEALVDVLRGRVKLSVHCYEPVDFDGIVRLSNEFKFPVASFHHAGSAYLVPDLLKKTYGGAPAIALFASNFRKKREAYRGSEFGPRILADNDIRVVMKSDHPVVNSRYLLNEAALAFYHGLPPNLALGSVTSVPAQAAGLGHRIGSIQKGYDADIVIWDSHPLSLGATPAQVYIDGIPQLNSPVVSPKSDSFQWLPKTPNFDKEAKETVEYEGLPPLQPRQGGDVLFTNVKSVWSQDDNGFVETQAVNEEKTPYMSVFVRGGKVVCIGESEKCLPADTLHRGDAEMINLEGGMLAPGLTTFGSPIGTVEIRLEASTNDGNVYDPLQKDTSSILGGDDAVMRAVDGLQFEGRNTLLAYRAGVTLAVTAPSGSGFWRGLSVAFDTGAKNALEEGAVVQEVAALHVRMVKGDTTSISTEVAVLRRLLLTEKCGSAFAAAAQGEIPLVVQVENADIMATLIRLKAEVEAHTGRRLRLSFSGAAEAWLLAAEIGKAEVGVILNPSRSFPRSWDERRFLSGPPLTYDTPLTTLLENGVTVAIGVLDEFAARNTRFDVAWAALESSGRIGELEAFRLATTNLETLLGVDVSERQRQYVAWKGGHVFDMASKAVAVFSASRGLHLF